MDGRTAYSNGRIADVLGRTADEVMTNLELSLVHPDDVPLYQETFTRAVANRSGWKNVLIRFRHKDGSYRSLESSAMPVFNLDGDLVGFQGMDRDVTQRLQIAAELDNAKMAAEAANNAKSRFLAAASHDLRQPLSALSLYVGVLPKLILPQAQDLAVNITKCVTSLSELLNDLLDMSKLDAGAVVPKKTDIVMDELFAKLKSVFDAKARMRGIRLKVRKSGLVVCSDPQLLQRVLGNLIDNAIRYTQKGGVLVSCRRHHGRHWVEVWDTGAGIDADKTGIIFEEFRQLGDQSRNRGSGLGLAIVAKTAELLNLKIRLRSRPGRGSMFAIELPPLAPSSGVTLKDPEQIVGTIGKSLCIALVEDNAQVLNAASVALNDQGHKVVAAPNGKKLFKQLGDRAPDIVISDFRLSGGESGFDVIAAARDVFGSQLPAIILTGDTDPMLMRMMARQGVQVQYKPLQIDELQAAIIKVMAAKPS
jgi:PAS domain S-box-containing protein